MSSDVEFLDAENRLVAELTRRWGHSVGRWSWPGCAGPRGITAIFA